MGRLDDTDHLQSGPHVGSRTLYSLTGIPDIVVVQDRRNAEEEDCDRSPALLGRSRSAGVHRLQIKVDFSHLR